MDSHAMDRIIEILERDPDFFVPVKKLWSTLQEEKMLHDMSLEDLTRVLEADGRFELTPGIDHQDNFTDDPLFAKEMENLGFFSGPRVKLISREMTAQDIFTGMTHSLTRMNQALQKAWEARPQDDQETEDQLLNILAAGQKLEREIQDLIGQKEVFPPKESQISE